MVVVVNVDDPYGAADYYFGALLALWGLYLAASGIKAAHTTSREADASTPPASEPLAPAEASGVQGAAPATVTRPPGAPRSPVAQQIFVGVTTSVLSSVIIGLSGLANLG
jgi:hypothetical protein